MSRYLRSATKVNDFNSFNTDVEPGTAQSIKSKKSRVKERTISYQKQREEILKLSEESAKKQFLII